MKKFLSSLVAVMALMLAFFVIRASAVSDIQVQIAPYYTEIDSISVYNPAVEYPLITYKDITYLPMTYGLCERLGLSVGFDAQKGLYITKHQVEISNDASGFFGNEVQNTVGEYYSATIPQYPIYLGGMKIQNQNEQYPILNFRGITYFPLTYRFATTELGFDVSFSNKGLIASKAQKSTYAMFGKSDEHCVNVIFGTDIPKAVLLPDGTNATTTETVYNKYKLFYNSDTLVWQSSDTKTSNDDYPNGEPPERCEEMTFEKDGLYYCGEKVLSFENANAQSLYTNMESFGDTAFIQARVSFSDIPAPYTAMENYLFVAKDNKAQRLEWDVKCNISNIFSDGVGGYYICSDYYSPMGASRWSNDFACVYRYTVNGEYYELKMEDINSIRAIGTYGTKLYVMAMYYGSEKENVINNAPRISAVNSGYYEIDAENGGVKKLYPYVPGTVFLSENGKLYLISDCGNAPRIIELTSGKIIY